MRVIGRKRNEKEEKSKTKIAVPDDDCRDEQ